VYPHIISYVCIDVSTHRCVYSIAECTHVSTHLFTHMSIAQHICLLICLLHNISDGRCKDTFCHACIYTIPLRNHIAITYTVYTYIHPNQPQLYNIVHIWKTECMEPSNMAKLQVIFRKRATNYRTLLQKMTYEDTASYGSSPPCI